MTVEIVITKSLWIYQTLYAKTAHHEKKNNTRPQNWLSRTSGPENHWCPSCCIKHPEIWGLGELLRTRVWRMGLEPATGSHSLATLWIWHYLVVHPSLLTISPSWVWNNLQGYLKPLSIWRNMFFPQVVIHIFIVPLNKAQNWWIAMGCFSQTTPSLLGGPILVETQNSWIKYDELPDFWKGEMSHFEIVWTWAAPIPRV